MKLEMTMPCVKAMSVAFMLQT